MLYCKVGAFWAFLLVIPIAIMIYFHLKRKNLHSCGEIVAFLPDGSKEYHSNIPFEDFPCVASKFQGFSHVVWRVADTKREKKIF